MELKLGDLVDNFNRSSKILYAHRSSNTVYWLPKQITSYHWLFKMRAKRAAASVSTKERQKQFSGHMIKCLLTELGRAGRENIWLSVRTHGPRCARSVRPDLEPNIFPSGPSTQSISTYSGPARARRTALIRDFFHMVFQGNCARVRTGHMINICYFFPNICEFADQS